MVGISKSDSKKAREALDKRTLQLRAALSAWKAEQKIFPKKNRKSARKIAKQFDVAVSTLNDHILGKHLVQKEYAASQQILSPAQEAEIVTYLQYLDKIAMPASRKDIERVGLEMLNRGHRAGKATLGPHWVDNFLSRHHSKISARWSSPLDRKRTDGLNKTTWEQHFALVKESTDEYNITPERDWGMDESPVMLGIAPKQRVYGRTVTANQKRVKQSYERRDGNRETLTVTECICGDGSMIRPIVIMRGKSLKKEWGADNPIEAMVCCSEKGSTDNVLTLEWLKFFDKETQHKAPNGEFRRIFLDGHKSHCTLAFLKYARLKNIVIICYPPHTTHALQGLDVVIFARVKKLWSEKLRQLDRGDLKVTKANFVRIYGEIRGEALSVSNVIAAWRQTGVWPFNPNAVDADQLAPALLTSTTTSAVKSNIPPEIADICDALKLRHLSINDSSTHSADLSKSDNSCIPSANPSTLPPATPPRRQVSEHIRRAVSGTAYHYVADPSTADFSSSTPIPDLHMTPIHHRNPQHPSYLPTPDLDSMTLEDAKEFIRQSQLHIAYQTGKINALEAQLLVAHQWVNGAQQKLYNQEHKKERSPLEQLAAEGKRNLTHDEWISALEKEENDKELTLHLKEGYKGWKEADEKDRKARHAVAVAEWEEYRRQFLEENPHRKRCDKNKPVPIKRPETPVEFWPIRPKRSTVAGDDVAEGEESDGEGDQD